MTSVPRENRSNKSGNKRSKKPAILEETPKRKQKNVKKVSKKARPEEKEIKDEPAVRDNRIHVIEKPAVEIQEIRALDHHVYSPRGTNYFLIIALVSILMFLLAGFLYPSTEEDIAGSRVIWAMDGKYDLGLFSQFYTAIAFTSGVFILGYHISSTFIKFNIKNWRIFLAGITVLFIFSLGKIGELIFNNEIFDMLKNLTLPIALIIMAYASYRIYSDINRAI